MFFDASTLPIQRRIDCTTQRNKDDEGREDLLLGRFTYRKVAIFSHSLAKIQKDMRCFLFSCCGEAADTLMFSTLVSAGNYPLTMIAGIFVKVSLQESR